MPTLRRVLSTPFPGGVGLDERAIDRLLALSAGGISGIAVTALAASVAWLVYFRLLGRLAWYCAERTAAAEREPDEDAET